MTTMTSSPGTATQAAVPGAPALPQVNLLPSEIRAGRQLRSVKAWLAVSVLVVLLVAGLGYVLATLLLSNANAELAATQDQNQLLIAEQAQYAEVTTVLREIDAVDEARSTGMASEVLWRPYVGAIAATAPVAVSVDNLSITGPSPDPTAPALITTNPIARIGIGTVTFTSRSLTLPDTATWIRNLEQVPGFADAWFSTASIAEEDGTVYYQVSGQVTLTEEALSGRFLPALEDVPAGGDADAATEGE